MEEALLIDSENMTLERLERYVWERRERMDQGKKNSDDFFLELLAEHMVEGGVLNAEEALQEITRRLAAVEQKLPPPKESAPRVEQLAKARVQAIAKYLWSLHPDMTRPEMATHEAIFNLKITGAKGYTPDTIKKWIAEVDPRPPEKKRGRPRKKRK
jgi:hypothetical protein